MSRISFPRLAFFIVIALGLSACANKNHMNNSGYGFQNGSYAPGSVQEFSQKVGDRVFFETDSTELNSTSMSTLNQQIQWLNTYSQYRIRLEGHADERGTREYNYSLGSRRARAVYDYIVARGINAQRIRTISYGKERPVAVCNDISCWSQNRRVVTVLEK